MKITLICKGGLEQADLKSGIIAGTELLVFGFQSVGEVSYEQELNGETAIFEKVARLSLEIGGTVVCGFRTNALGHVRNSALVASNGQILGVSDAVYAIDEEVGAGTCFRVYETGQGRVGVAVGTDLYFSETAKALTDCGCDYIVCPFAKTQGVIESVLARAYAFLYGIPVLFCGDGYSLIASEKGEILYAAAESGTYEVDLKSGAEYHLITRRRRGFLDA